MDDIYEIIFDLFDFFSLYQNESCFFFEDIIFKFLSFMKFDPGSMDIEILIDTEKIPLRPETKFLFDISRCLRYYLINNRNLHPIDIRFNVIPCLNIEYVEDFKKLFHICCDLIIEKFKGLEDIPFVEKVRKFKESLRYLVGELRDNRSWDINPDIIPGEEGERF